LKILVTGGAGFIGSEFVRALLQDKYSEFGLKPDQVVVIDALTYAGNLNNLAPISGDRRFSFVHGNINDFKLMLDNSKECDLIVNFAAESHVDRSIENPAIFIETNVLGAFSVLEVAKQNKVKRVIQISTDEVYGSIENGSWDEESPLEPNSPYSASKASADLLARSYFKTYSLDIITTRCCNNFGPYQNSEKLIPKLITNLMNGLDLPIYGSGLNVREWVHVSDHARAIAFLAINGKAGEIYNIGGGDGVTNIEIAKKVIELFGVTQSRVISVKDRAGHDFRYSLSDSKIKKMGFEFKINFESGLNETINWYKLAEKG
jgi:dTDP-glucose 4,6-dehydratase